MSLTHEIRYFRNKIFPTTKYVKSGYHVNLLKMLRLMSEILNRETNRRQLFVVVKFPRYTVQSLRNA